MAVTAKMAESVAAVEAQVAPGASQGKQKHSPDRTSARDKPPHVDVGTGVRGGPELIEDQRKNGIQFAQVKNGAAQVQAPAAPRVQETREQNPALPPVGRAQSDYINFVIGGIRDAVNNKSGVYDPSGKIVVPALEKALGLTSASEEEKSESRELRYCRLYFCYGDIAVTSAINRLPAGSAVAPDMQAFLKSISNAKNSGLPLKDQMKSDGVSFPKRQLPVSPSSLKPEEQIASLAEEAAYAHLIGDVATATKISEQLQTLVDAKLHPTAATLEETATRIGQRIVALRPANDAKLIELFATISGKQFDLWITRLSGLLPSELSVADAASHYGPDKIKEARSFHALTLTDRAGFVPSDRRILNEVLQTLYEKGIEDLLKPEPRF